MPGKMPGKRRGRGRRNRGGAASSSATSRSAIVAPFDESGEDTDGLTIGSLREMWDVELARRAGDVDADVGEDAGGQESVLKKSKLEASSSAVPREVLAKKDMRWYKHAESYWEEQTPDVEGMLGGFGVLDEPDCVGSTAFLTPFFTGRGVQSAENKMKNSGPSVVPSRGRALDVGAGVGRVTMNFLLPFGFAEVDLLEQNARFASLAKENLSVDRSGKPREHLGEIFVCGMQDHIFEPDRRYDCIWIQWCVIYLSDVDFIRFFRDCKSALTDGGLIVLKDNCTDKGFVIDRDDSSITRSEPHLRWLFSEAGLTCVRMRTQDNFPKNLFPVRMFALR